jgi:predicted transposase YdaD
MVWTKNVEAEDKIREDERLKEKLQIARGMKNDGLPIGTIQKYTGLTKDDIEKL